MSAFSRQQLVVAIALGTAALAASPAVTQAQVPTNTLQMNVEVTNTCAVQGATLDFDTYERNQSAPKDAEATLVFENCPDQTQVRLSGGGQGDPVARRMNGSNGGNLRYILSQASGHATNWGDTEATDRVYTGSNMTVYGRIPASQSPPVGTFTDTVMITLVLP